MKDPGDLDGDACSGSAEDSGAVMTQALDSINARENRT